MALKPNLNTVRNKIFLANSYENGLADGTSNTYLGIAKPIYWSSNVPPIPIETTESLNEIFRTLVSIKKITSSDINLVVPRVDWTSGTTYDEYTENLDLYTYETLTAINGTSNTSFNASEELIELEGNGTNYLTSLSTGDKIVMLGDGSETAPKVLKEVTYIDSSSLLTVNSIFQHDYTGNTVYKLTSSYPYYANKFYVRNTQDQIFKCLYNNSSEPSTVMPQISLDGSLPENAYIETSDGYKWKYMYTIPAGMKEKFFTSQWMPVVSESIVTNSAVNGRLDIFKINDGGSGYQAAGNSNSALIVSVSGDGSSANLSATVVDGVITKINIFNSGIDYTNTAISFNDVSKVAATDTANVIAVIGPQNGHGYDPAYELGATSLMVSVDLSGTENSTIPTNSAIDNFDYRQIILLRNPKSTDGSYLSGTNYKTCSIISVTPPPSQFRMDETVYQGTSLELSTFSATVVYWDNSANELWVNDPIGTFTASATLKGTTQTSAVTAFTLTEPTYKKFTGEILYIENRDAITRSSSQTEQIKLILSF
jgi:hypothetical protein